ncbi:unnamed protein product, partial [Heligmosomoides polygyrus]|uniref:DUF862 domain-containing protein n=1 Tax=Heligmosomoides polygyrus TaxID=6339 RepID=A0A183GFU4_HELPZ
RKSIYWLNDYASNIGFGIFHSGIEVHGVEYAYGGHPYAFSGVFENSPQDAEELGENFKFRQCIVIGETAFTAGAVRELIKSLGQEYRGDRYHLISRNCNHFSAVLAKVSVELTGKGFEAKNLYPSVGGQACLALNDLLNQQSKGCHLLCQSRFSSSRPNECL